MLFVNGICQFFRLIYEGKRNGENSTPFHQMLPDSALTNLVAAPTNLAASYGTGRPDESFWRHQASSMTDGRMGVMLR